LWLEIEVRRQLVNDGADSLEESRRMAVNPYREIVCRPSLLTIERCDIKGVNRIAVDFGLWSVNNNRIA
jgi:hypothetical protein